MPPRPPTNTPGVRVIRLTDFEQASSLFSNWQGRFEQLSRGPFAGDLKVVRGGIVRVIAIESNQRVSLRGRDAAGLFSVYPVSAGNAASVWQGRRLAPGQLVVHGTDAETDHCSARQTTDHLGVSLRPEVLEEAARVLLKAAVPALTHTWAVLAPPPDAFAALNRQLTRLMTAGVTDPSLLGTAEGHRLEQECVRSLVAALLPPSAPTSDASLPGRTQFIRRADEFMRTHLSDPVGAIDLCRELGVSDRTLRLAFRERYGLGPMAYYKKIRLNAVRARLKADPFVTVVEAAREFGFHHLGNFAADYRRLFGEQPSTTKLRLSDGSETPTDDQSRT